MRDVLVCRDVDDEELIPNKTETRRSSPVRLAEMVIGGFAASFGTAQGPAVFVADPEDPLSLGGIPEGSVLVSQKAHPNLTMVIPRLGALVVENGGMLSTVAEAARVHAIPAVMGATGLSEKIHEGDIVRVEGRNGVVKLIRKR
ncbi:MAG TPA: hypothetical protein DCR97_12930 [Deltaproteobacteria bacterium]|nr:hypothetical protein [Deltaproteobacteria bacterium]